MFPKFSRLKMRIIRKVSCRCLLTCSAISVIIVIIFILSKYNPKPEHAKDILEPGFARKSWGLVDKIKVSVEDEKSRELSKKIRVLCLVLTMKGDQESKALAVNQTWGRRCTRLLFVVTESLADLPHIVVDIDQSRDHLTAKTFAMFKYAHEHHSQDFDWFLKADDDTFVVMENLRYLLSFLDPTKDVYLGHHFKRYVDQGYMSGGAGYIISQRALKTFGDKSHLCVSDGWEEDVDFGKCMSKIGVPPFESKDILGRNSFHSAHFSDDLYWMGYIEKHAVQVKGPIHIGPSCCSQLSISFHKVSPQLMYFLEFLLYRMAVFGRHTPDKLFTDFFQPKQIPKLTYTEDLTPHFQ